MSETDRRVNKVIGHDARGTRRGLSEGCVTKTKLFKEECIVAEQVRCLLRANEWGDWVGLGAIKYKLRNRSIGETGCTNHIPDDEHWDLELRRGVWRNPLNRANGPIIRRVAEANAVRWYLQGIVAPVHTQATKWHQLNW